MSTKRIIKVLTTNENVYNSFMEGPKESKIFHPPK